MTDRRELSRQAARRQRAVAKSEMLGKTNANCELATNAVNRARLVVADPDFIKILLQNGIQSIPKCLAADAIPSKLESGSNPKERLDRISLEFAVAWRFLYPLLANTQAKAHLETIWPGFISDLKDAFIALVVDGPFPRATSSHRGRKHHDNYFG